MYVIRDEFHLKFGKARDARAALEEFVDEARKQGYDPVRMLTDFTGPSYRLILEMEVESLGEYEKRLTSTMAEEKWRETYQKFIPHVDSSTREILKIVS